MKAQIKAGYNSQRVKLAEVLPLETPFTVNICVSQKCNFRCKYCTHGKSSDEKKRLGLKMIDLSYNEFKEIAYQLKAFPEKIKMIAITGLGEPLLNKNVGKMISLLNELEVAENIELYTNAYCLNKKMTEQLVNAGLTKLRISIQGVNKDKYKEISDVDIDFDELVDNISFFYNNRKNTKVYVKIIDIALNDNEDEEFYSIFGDICDEIYIEHMIDTQKTMNHYNNTVDKGKGLYGNKVLKKINVCKFPFYSMQIDVEGNVFPCLPLGLTKEFSIGNVKNDNLRNMWNGEKINKIRRKLLEVKKDELVLCKDCDVFSYYDSSINECDNLDNDREKLIEKYSKRYINF